MSVKLKVLDILRSKEWVDCSDFEAAFPPRVEGHLSWAQRLRELRADGYQIIKRRKVSTKSTFEYSLEDSEPPLPEQEELYAESFRKQEEAINLRAAKQLSLF